MILRLVLQTVLWLAAMGALLVVPAGTLRWPGAWAWLAEFGALSLASGLWLARRDPGLLAECLGPPLRRQGPPGWDRALMAGFLLLWAGWLLAMGREVGRHGPAQLPPWVQAAGALLVALGIGIACLACRANSFAVPVVMMQPGRGQRVVTEGPYRWVRHPMYAGALPIFLGTPLLLGAWRGLAFVPLLAALLMLRAVGEERMLRAGLPGYAAYAARVRYRLVPWLW